MKRRGTEILYSSEHQRCKFLIDISGNGDKVD